MNNFRSNNFGRTGFGGSNFGNNAFSQNPWEEIKRLFKSNMLAKLIIINVVVWLVLRIVIVFAGLFNVEITSDLLYWLAVPAHINNLITHPWTLLTYMFLHESFWHILFNMLWLYWFGRIFLEFLNERQLLSTYLMGGLAGAIVYIASYNLFPRFQDDYIKSLALGASASVTAIVMAISFYVPNYRINLLFLGPVRILYIAMGSILLDVLAIDSDNSGGHLAHLGGAMWGFLYIYMLKNGHDFSTIFNKIPRFNFSGKGKKAKKTKFKNVYTNERPKSDEDYNMEKKQNQAKIDKILDKISKSGYESLTREEKEILFRSSNKH
ncbi:MAG TPA: rhomboid family intramembrane serine protease [Bacteroidales bacterium]|nr:rhomboid family intramembrane serine protease [Bacteroidales bacterium]HRX97320.1 rhomboid family intramembrane serine protease [Bacteroidales bacterium]